MTTKTETPERVQRKAERRFWPKVDKGGPLPAAWSPARKAGPCWLWTAACNGAGYGNFGLNGGNILAHRFSYELAYGPIAPDLELDHLCRITRCVNPGHLEAVTHRENVLRGDSPQAALAAQTHCKRGHEFTPENSYVTPRGDRRCRVCRRAYEKAKGATETPERIFQSQVLDLAKLRGWMTAHFNDSRRQVKRANGASAYIGDKNAAGFPDLVLTRHGRLIFVELKREKGRLTEAQREWLYALEHTAAEVHVWRPSMWPLIEQVLE